MRVNFLGKVLTTDGGFQLPGYNPLDELTGSPLGSMSPVQLGAIVILLMMTSVYMFFRSRTVWHTLGAMMVSGLAAYLTLCVTGYPDLHIDSCVARLTDFARRALRATGIM